MNEPCRCGHVGGDPHPCHGQAYKCRKPASRRFMAYPTCLSGVQMKLGAYETWACDECWEAFKKERGDERQGTG